MVAFKPFGRIHSNVTAPNSSAGPISNSNGPSSGCPSDKSMRSSTVSIESSELQKGTNSLYTSSNSLIRNAFKYKETSQSDTLANVTLIFEHEEQANQAKEEPLELYKKFKEESMSTVPLSGNLHLMNFNGESPEYEVKSALSIDFDNPSLDFNVNLPQLEEHIQAGTETEGTSVQSPFPLRQPTVLESSTCKTRTSAFDKVKNLLYRSNANQIITYKTPLQELSSSSDSSSSDYSPIVSPVPSPLPVAESCNSSNHVPLDISLFQEEGDDTYKEFFYMAQDVDSGKRIKFKQYVDMLIYSSKSHSTSPSLLATEDYTRAENATTNTSSSFYPKPDSSSTLASGGSLSPRKRLRKRSSLGIFNQPTGTMVNGVKKRRSLSLSFAKKSCQDISNTTRTYVAPKSSILKNKVNENFAVECENTIRDDALNIDTFLKNFERFEQEKFQKEPQLQKYRRQQIIDYYTKR
ncbi:uncharacterized protein RJT20DRAFT_130137 [Scheffersomyces xylosifermentans]|uniref:uncharacterized protein n=1 Tax=Scheffersomyces xylosifermentans TaxID=1304137 RepID=UPI00315D2054